MKTNLMHCLSSVYFFIQPLHVSGIFVAHHQEEYCMYTTITRWFNPLNAELNPICYLLALLGAHHILHVSRVRVNKDCVRVMETNLMHYYPQFFRQSTSTCFGHICSPSSGGLLYIYNNWYVLCFSVDCLLAGRPAGQQTVN